MRFGRVVVLNGVGSVGKSSTARALQGITATPFLHVAMDQFIDMAPARLLDSEEGLRFERREESGHPSVIVSTGPALDRLMDGMRHAIAAMAARGNNLIVDDVFWDGEEREYRRLLGDGKVELVGLFAPLEVIEDRERARRDRIPGLARWQYPRVHRGVTYDLEVDMTDATPAQAAAIIRDSLVL